MIISMYKYIELNRRTINSIRIQDLGLTQPNTQLGWNLYVGHVGELNPTL